MREVRDFATAIRTSVEALRRTTEAAKGELMTEIQRGNVNAEKVRSMTKELKEANLEVESFLGETGSNFSNSEESNTQAPPRADINGVTLNNSGSTT